MRKILYIPVVLLVFCGVCNAQTERNSVRKGNRDFGKSRFEEAEINYKKALVADSTSAVADYNLGNTYFRLENFTEAEKYYSAAADSLSSGKYGADLYHNMGNSLLSRQDYQGAIEAYKNALRRRPDDMDTKSNLAYAQKMLQNQQNQQNQDQNQNNQNNQDNQDQNKDQQDQNKDQQDQNKDQQDQNQDRDKDNQDQQDQQNQQDQQDKQNQQDRQNQQGQQPKINPQAAQQMLQAIQDQEKETQDKVKKEKALKMRSKQKEKNW